jgi:DNA-binding NarL/FixJ family response regulator
MAKKKIRILIVDDHEGVRRGIRTLLKNAPDIQVADEAENGADAISLARELQVQVILLDVELPLVRGMEVARTITSMRIPARILAISSYSDPQTIYAMMDSGAVGYLSKDDLPDVLIPAIRKAAGQMPGWIGLTPPEASDDMASIRVTLTNREFQVLRLLLQGFSFEEIAASLETFPEVVDRYVAVLLAKYQVRSVEDLKRQMRKLDKQ